MVGWTGVAFLCSFPLLFASVYYFFVRLVCMQGIELMPFFKKKKKTTPSSSYPSFYLTSALFPLSNKPFPLVPSVLVPLLRLGEYQSNVVYYVGLSPQ